MDRDLWNAAQNPEMNSFEYFNQRELHAIEVIKEFIEEFKILGVKFMQHRIKKCAFSGDYTPVFVCVSYELGVK